MYNSEYILDASSVKFKTIVAKDKAIGMRELYKEMKWPGCMVRELWELWERQKGSREGVRKSTVERRDERGQVSFL